MKQTPISRELVDRMIAANGIKEVGKASIREIKRLINDIENASGIKFVRMEMGIPGIPACKIGVDAQVKALQDGIATIYPDLDGTPELKRESSRFIKNFIDLDISPESCFPTVGSMMAGLISFMTLARREKQKDTTLFIDPGFPVQKNQHKILGLKYETFDVYDFRGNKLRAKLESYLKKGNIHSIIYSNPNNPSWVCFTDEELRIIGELATQYDVCVIEDLAYFGMDFRRDISKPGVPPFQPSVGKYTDNYALMISGSKAFSYAGERIAVLAVSDKFGSREFPDLVPYFGHPMLRRAMINGAVYAVSSGTSHSAQFALAAIFKACNDGTYNYLDDVREYAEKAHIMKKIFTDNGFKIVYDHDGEEEIADGFYFTLSYPGLSGEELLHDLLYYGISAISLASCNSTRTEGLRACVSLVNRNQFPALEERAKLFNENHRNA
ncbi:MAG: pyridoxal phosphate-dependent aminotransferase [Bacteroidales bacterium]|nr:pyridoxal phosphate-dependent aminotransferase [Bacteroidales bacterium]MBR0054914.1 pyridoxal phosphate-dependent aminotransferase [Bacteroidales bacterium]